MIQEGESSVSQVELAFKFNVSHSFILKNIFPCRMLAKVYDVEHGEYLVKQHFFWY